MTRPPALVLSLLLAATFPFDPTSAHDGAPHTDASGDEPGSASAPRAREFPHEWLDVPDLPVVDRHGERDGIRSRLAGTGTLLVGFTYTGCETLCPIANAILADVDARLAGTMDPPLHIVTLSLDPSRDTPAALDAMADSLGASDRWIWLTAAPADNRRLLASFGADVATLESHDPMFLIGDLAERRFVRVVGMPEPERLIAIARAFDERGDSRR